METTRRGFVGSIMAALGLAATPKVVKAEPTVGGLGANVVPGGVAVKAQPHWHYTEYHLPQLVGFKGYYWVSDRGEDGTWDEAYGIGKSIIAYRTLDDRILATPWMIQAPDYRAERKAMAQELEVLWRSSTKRLISRGGY